MRIKAEMREICGDCVKIADKTCRNRSKNEIGL